MPRRVISPTEITAPSDEYLMSWTKLTDRLQAEFEAICDCGGFQVLLVEGEFRTGAGDVLANDSTGLPAHPFFLQPPFGARETAFERFVDRRRRGRETALQNLIGSAGERGVRLHPVSR